MLTLFTTPKPFVGHIDVIQRNAIASWKQLGDQVQILLIGQEKGTDQAARDFEVTHIPQVALNSYGTPRLDSIFETARQAARFPWLCYVNADIILMDDLLPTVQTVVDEMDRFLLVGQRWDLDVGRPIEFNPGWQSALRATLETQGNMHPPAGSDYFVFPKNEFRHMPPFALGRAGWDNWMIFTGRQLRIPVIDASRSITLVHQNHDYAHLPGGQPHYRLPESEENVRMAGGRWTVFTLQDVNWVIDSSGLRRIRPGWGSIKRWLEAGLIASLGPGRMSRLVFWVFRPLDTIRYYWHALNRRIRRWIQPEEKMRGEH